MCMMPDSYNYLASRNRKVLYVQSQCSRFNWLREVQLALADGYKLPEIRTFEAREL